MDTDAPAYIRIPFPKSFVSAIGDPIADIHIDVYAFGDGYIIAYSDGDRNPLATYIYAFTERYVYPHGRIAHKHRYPTFRLDLPNGNHRSPAP